MENVKTRLSAFYKEIGITKREFERRCGFSNGYLDKLKDCPSSDKLEIIYLQFPQLNKIWLLTGEGEMLVSDTPVVEMSDTLGDLVTLTRLHLERGHDELDRLIALMEKREGITRKSAAS